MLTLPADRFRAVMGLLLVLSTAALALGVDRLVDGAMVAGWTLLALGVALVAAAFTLRIEGDPREVTLMLLTREACPLCDEALAIARHVQDDVGFALWEVDVTEDRELVQRYGDQLPVLMADGEVVASLQVSEADVRAAVGG